MPHVCTHSHQNNGHVNDADKIDFQGASEAYQPHGPFCSLRVKKVNINND